MSNTSYYKHGSCGPAEENSYILVLIIPLFADTAGDFH